MPSSNLEEGLARAAADDVGKVVVVFTDDASD